MKGLNAGVLCISLMVFFFGCSTSSKDLKKMADELYAVGVKPDPLPPHEFKSDGCSCFPDGDWVECCVDHDFAYWKGGTMEERKGADAKLRGCVAYRGFPIIAGLMYYGVRLGGVWWLPTPFRWGFGWPFPQSGPPGKPY